MNYKPPKCLIKICFNDGTQEILMGNHHSLNTIQEKIDSRISRPATVFLTRPENNGSVLVNLSNVTTVEEYDEEYEKNQERKVMERLAFGESDKRLAFTPPENPIKSEVEIDPTEYPFVDETGASYQHKDVVWVNRMCPFRKVWVIGYFTVQSYDLSGDSRYWESVSIHKDANPEMYQAAHDEEKWSMMKCPEFIIKGVWTESSWEWYKKEKNKNVPGGKHIKHDIEMEIWLRKQDGSE